MRAPLTLGSAFVFGLVASGHCLAMCGGITGALAMATQTNSAGRARWPLLLGYQAGRIVSYGLAGIVLGTAGATILHFLDQQQTRIALRWMSACVFALVGISLLRRRGGPGTWLARTLWPSLAQYGRRFFPVRHLAQAFAIGAIWGWMPCGLVYSVLFIAWLEMDPWHSAAVMLMFGLGTVPAVLAGAVGAIKLRTLLAHAGLRYALAVLLLVFAVLTAAGPWLVAHGMPAAAMSWMPFDCTVD
ncbi:MAG: sulfite exporter TauE/SafE family protein [Rhodanobacter sp.]|nr:sulfite exporter TauE/SafE family protein [Rhodanobacter sp.]